MVQKRLAAVLSADIVGFSRLMGEDEQGTFRALQEFRTVTDPAIAARDGRIVGTAGDSILAEFVSVLDAVEAAADIQAAGRQFNSSRAEQNQFVYRIGIDLGDVMVADDGDIFGDGVNIAARLQSIAPPGGIYVSEAVYRSVHRRTEMGFQSVGERFVKNISDPIPVWAVKLEEFAQVPEVGATRNPYRGLRSFREQDAGDFFGRAPLINSLLGRLDGDQRFLAVVGPSGSGKSSVIRAGLIPALAGGGLDGSQDWLIARMVPGSHPFAELESALLRAAGNPADMALHEMLTGEDLSILRAVLRVLPDEDSQLLLFIDQFEEVFSLVESEATRSDFLQGLVEATQISGGRLRTLVAMRADFYDGPLLYPAFGELFTSHVVNVLPLSSADLQAAIVEPARNVGVEVEPDLVSQLVADVQGQPGALPLFQYALSELFEARSDQILTLDGYRAIGGVETALTRRADELYSQLAEEEQAAAKQMFLRLVNISEDSEDTRRRVPTAELGSLGVPTPAMQAAMDTFGRSRLVTFDRDAASSEPTVEVAHEAIIRGWGRLREWVDENRSELRIHSSFVDALREWLDAEEDDGFLLTGARLGRFERWSARDALELTDVERRFLQKSTELRATEEAERQAREQQQERLKRQSRTRLIAAALAVTALIAVLGVTLINLLGPDQPPLNIIYAGRDDPAIGAVVAAGIDRAERELDVDVTEIVAVTSLRDEFESAASTGGLVVAIGEFDSAEMLEVSSEFPEASYAAIDLTEAPDATESVTRVIYAEAEGAFLVGAAAALQTNTGVVGFIGGIPIDSIEEFRAGYEAGVHEIDPDVTVLATYLVSETGDPDLAFSSPELGRLAAERLYEAGADVIFHASGLSGLGVLEAAAEGSDDRGTDLWFIGVDGDEYLQWQSRPDLQAHILTSMLKRFDLGVVLVIERYLEGTLDPGEIELGLADNGVALSMSGGFIDAHRGRIEELKSRIVNGGLDVPQVPSGELLPLLAGQSAPDGTDLTAALRSYLQAIELADWQTASSLLTSESAMGPFQTPVREFFAFDAAFEPEFSNVDCGTSDGVVSCSADVTDRLTAALGQSPARRTYSAIVTEEGIRSFVSVEGSDDQDISELFGWLSSEFTDEFETACGGGLSGECAILLIDKLDQWVEQRGD